MINTNANNNHSNNMIITINYYNYDNYSYFYSGQSMPSISIIIEEKRQCLYSAHKYRQ